MVEEKEEELIYEEDRIPTEKEIFKKEIKEFYRSMMMIPSIKEDVEHLRGKGDGEEIETLYGEKQKLSKLEILLFGNIIPTIIASILMFAILIINLLDYLSKHK